MTFEKETLIAIFWLTNTVSIEHWKSWKSARSRVSIWTWTELWWVFFSGKLPWFYILVIWTSCLDVYIGDGEDGMYHLNNPDGESSIVVYCEYHKGYGYMFISSESWKNNNQFNLDSMLPYLDTSKALLR